ncbi:hypothetical protein Hanom_Chr05g00419431 [Helianthus anomalus]
MMPTVVTVVGLNAAHLILAGYWALDGWRLVFLPIKVSTANKQDRRVVIVAALQPESWATPKRSSLWDRIVSEDAIRALQAHTCKSLYFKNIKYDSNSIGLINIPYTLVTYKNC